LMDTEDNMGYSLRPDQKETLDGLVRRFFVGGERCLLVEAPTGVGKTRIALEFVREFWRRRGRCRVLVVVPRRVLAYNPWKKEIDRWMSDLEPKCLILSGFMPPRERMLKPRTHVGRCQGMGGKQQHNGVDRETYAILNRLVHLIQTPTRPLHS
jgi:superfamily II DNA or RNA helicase